MTAVYYVWYLIALMMDNKSFFEFFKTQLFDWDYLENVDKEEKPDPK